MKLFMIIYVMGSVGGYAGPLPYDMVECQKRAAVYESNLRTAFKVYGDAIGEDIPPDDIKMSCEFRKEAPIIEEDTTIEPEIAA